MSNLWIQAYSHDEYEPYTMYHGTSEERAKSIMKNGFDGHADESNGKSAGHGVYLSDHRHKAAEYGTHVVKVHLSGNVEIHPNPWRDPDYAGVHTDNLHHALAMEGYHGHEDPDERGTVIVHPQHANRIRPLSVEPS